MFSLSRTIPTCVWLAHFVRIFISYNWKWNVYTAAICFVCCAYAAWVWDESVFRILSNALVGIIESPNWFPLLAVFCYIFAPLLLFAHYTQDCILQFDVEYATIRKINCTISSNCHTFWYINCLSCFVMCVQCFECTYFVPGPVVRLCE